MAEAAEGARPSKRQRPTSANTVELIWSDLVDDAICEMVTPQPRQAPETGSSNSSWNPIPGVHGVTVMHDHHVAADQHIHGGDNHPSSTSEGSYGELAPNAAHPHAAGSHVHLMNITADALVEHDGRPPSNHAAAAGVDGGAQAAAGDGARRRGPYITGSKRCGGTCPNCQRPERKQRCLGSDWQQQQQPSQTPPDTVRLPEGLPLPPPAVEGQITDRAGAGGAVPDGAVPFNPVTCTDVLTLQREYLALAARMQVVEQRYQLAAAEAAKLAALQRNLGCAVGVLCEFSDRLRAAALGMGTDSGKQNTVNVAAAAIVPSPGPSPNPVRLALELERIRGPCLIGAEEVQVFRFRDCANGSLSFFPLDAIVLAGCGKGVVSDKLRTQVVNSLRVKDGVSTASVGAIATLNKKANSVFGEDTDYQYFRGTRGMRVVTAARMTKVAKLLVSTLHPLENERLTNDVIIQALSWLETAPALAPQAWEHCEWQQGTGGGEAP